MMTHKQVDGYLPGMTKDIVIDADLRATMALAIFKKRETLGMTQKEFANHVGVSQGMVSRWESMECNFTFKAVADICAKLDLDVALEVSQHFDTKLTGLPMECWGLSTASDYNTGLLDLEGVC